MSLLQAEFTPCVYIDKAHVDDGYGGQETAWVEGAQFNAAFYLNDSIQAKIAEKQGVTGLYTVTTRKDVNLQYHEVFKRKSDGKIFRVTSDGDDKKTPESAGLNMRQVSAEEWELPRGEEEP